MLDTVEDRKKKLLKFTPSFWERAQNKTENEIHSRSQYLIVWFKSFLVASNLVSLGHEAPVIEEPHGPWSVW